MAKADKVSNWQGEVDSQTGVVRLSGEIDFTNSQQVRDWLAQAFLGGQGDAQVDLSQVSYIDSSGLAVLIEARKALKARDRSIRVCAASLQVHKLFSLTQIGDLFGI